MDWLDREMANVVTDEAVQQVCADAQAQGQQDLPPMDALRPQVEQHLRQQAMQDLTSSGQSGAQQSESNSNGSGEPTQDK